MSKPVTLASNDIQAAQVLVQEHLARPWSAPQYTPEQEAAYKARITELLKQHNAVLVAHYYTDPIIQALAEATGGCVSDSLEMARFGIEKRDHARDELRRLTRAGTRFDQKIVIEVRANGFARLRIRQRQRHHTGVVLGRSMCASWRTALHRLPRRSGPEASPSNRHPAPISRAP
jgi:hypothetical protein